MESLKNRSEKESEYSHANSMTIGDHSEVEQWGQYKWKQIMLQVSVA